MDTYSIEADGQGAFNVRAAKQDNRAGLAIATFPTPRQAQEWIDNQIRMTMTTATASDLT
jgi:hypothetical protein